VIASTFGTEALEDSWRPVMASEDFAFMLQRKAGCFVLVGNGNAPGGCELHNSRYGFNDDLLASGIEYWRCLVEHRLQN
jgi:hippurate hydrolase